MWRSSAALSRSQRLGERVVHQTPAERACAFLWEDGAQENMIFIFTAAREVEGGT